ncbi:hypothetical protein GCM10025781_26450 [Kocuria gwangalliensis]|uniref:Uncharacterized protein n=1 Tax=Kocuria gwangalliensis TaxID=501592 RepID=A0ABP8XDF8_9MICC
MNLVIESHAPDASSTELSVTRAAAILDVSAPVLRKGLNGGTIPDLSMGTIADLAGRHILTKVEMDGNAVPVLRAGLARQHPDEERRFSGWMIDQPIADTTVALDRWWTAPGRDLIIAAGGFVVAMGSVVCAVLGDIDESRLVERGDRINYNATLAGVLRSDSQVEITGANPWAGLARRVIGSRVLGGGGGNFTRV